MESFKEVFLENTYKTMDPRKWKKFAKTLQQVFNTKKILVDQIRVINNSSIEIFGDIENLEHIQKEILPLMINSKMKTTLHYTGGDNKSGIPMLSIYEV